MAGNDDKKLIDLVLKQQKGEGLRKPGLHHVAVYHDDWCAIFKEQLCDCDPDVELMATERTDQ